MRFCGQIEVAEMVAMEDVVVRVPADMGSWGVGRVFREGRRLLREHVVDFLPGVLFYIFPAALIEVLYMQFLFVGHVQLQLHQRREGESSHLGSLIYYSIVSQAPEFFIYGGSILLFFILTNVVYTDCDGGPWHTEPLFRSAAFALFRKNVETENPVLRTTATEHSLYERVRKTSKGKKLKACAVVVACWMTYMVVASGGILFTPTAVAQMGLPPATISLFTVLMTLLTTATTTYLILVNLVLFIWICSPMALIPK